MIALLETTIRKNHLKKLENLLEALKNDPYDEFIHVAIEEFLKQLTGAREVSLYVIRDSNAGIIPVYDNIIIRGLSKLFSKLKNETPEQIRAYIKDEMSKHIDELIIFIGLPLIRKFSAGELTAIMLHELGHAYYRNADIIYTWFMLLITTHVIATGGLLSIILAKSIDKKAPWYLRIFKYLIFLVPTFFLSILTIGAALRVITQKIGHRIEFHADDFAVKNGYGMELANALKKIKEPSNVYGITPAKDKLSQFLFKILIFGGLAKTHPHIKERVCKIYDKMLNEYKRKYKDYEKVIGPLFEKNKCERILNKDLSKK